MNHVYQQLEEDLERDWIKGGQLEQQLEQQFDALTDKDWRRFLYQYTLNYYEVYHTDWLDEAFIFIEEVLEDAQNKVLLQEERSKIQQEIIYVKGEYSWSLSAIAEAVEPLLYEEPLTQLCIRTSVNAVLFAYSCHLNANAFLKREETYLCALFLELANNV